MFAYVVCTVLTFAVHGFTSSPARPELLIGQPPFCQAICEDCERYDLHCLGVDVPASRGCFFGNVVRCAARTINGTRRREQSLRNSVTVLTYNVWELPHFPDHIGQRERTCHIPRAVAQINRDIDVLVFQEATMGGCVPDELSMRTLLTYYGWPHSTATVGKLFPRPVNGGVFIASRWPILETDTYNYEHQVLLRQGDLFLSKGVAYVKIRKANITVNVFGTHLHAYVSAKHFKVRQSQARELLNFMQSKRIDSSEVVVISGDLNEDLIHYRSETEQLLRILNVTMPAMEELQPSYDPRTNELLQYMTPDSPAEFLDYVTTHAAFRAPKSARMEVVRIRSDRAFEFCSSAPLRAWYISSRSVFCRKSQTTTELSDHYSVLATLEF